MEQLCQTCPHAVITQKTRLGITWQASFIYQPLTVCGRVAEILRGESGVSTAHQPEEWPERGDLPASSPPHAAAGGQHGECARGGAHGAFRSGSGSPRPHRWVTLIAAACRAMSVLCSKGIKWGWTQDVHGNACRCGICGVCSVLAVPAGIRLFSQEGYLYHASSKSFLSESLPASCCTRDKFCTADLQE